MHQLLLLWISAIVMIEVLMHFLGVFFAVFPKSFLLLQAICQTIIFCKRDKYLQDSGFKFNFFDSLLKLASSIIFYLLNLSATCFFTLINTVKFGLKP